MPPLPCLWFYKSSLHKTGREQARVSWEPQHSLAWKSHVLESLGELALLLGQHRDARESLMASCSHRYSRDRKRKPLNLASAASRTLSSSSHLTPQDPIDLHCKVKSVCSPVKTESSLIQPLPPHCLNRTLPSLHTVVPMSFVGLHFLTHEPHTCATPVTQAAPCLHAMSSK